MSTHEEKCCNKCNNKCTGNNINDNYVNPISGVTIHHAIQNMSKEQIADCKEKVAAIIKILNKI